MGRGRLTRWGWIVVTRMPLAACHHGGTAAPPQAIGKTEFVTRANDICRSGNARQSTLPSPTSDAEKIAVLDQAIAITTDMVKQIKALPQPPSDRATLADLYAKYQAVIDLGVQQSAAAKAGQSSKVDELTQQLRSASNAANAASNAYGLTVCGS